MDPIWDGQISMGVVPVGIVVLHPGQDVGILATGNFDLCGLSICCRGNFHREKNTVEGWQRLKRLWSQHRKWDMFLLFGFCGGFFELNREKQLSMWVFHSTFVFLGKILWVRKRKGILMYIFGRSNPKWMIKSYRVGMIKKHLWKFCI